MNISEHAWTCPDGQPLRATAVLPEQPRAALVIASGLGVPRHFYRRFAQGLVDYGILTVTFDYRGTGDSSLKVGRGRDARMSDWGAHDLTTVLTEVFRAWPELPVFGLGHSAGGQLLGLAPATSRLAGIVLVAAHAPHWRFWPGWQKLGMWLLLTVALPLLCAGRDQFPARLLRLASIDVPSGAMRQCGRWWHTPRYLFNPVHRLDTSGYRSLSAPALEYSFTDDWYAPAAAVEALLREYPNLPVQRRRLSASDIGVDRIGHFGFFAPACRETLWPETARWITATATGA